MFDKTCARLQFIPGKMYFILYVAEQAVSIGHLSHWQEQQQQQQMNKICNTLEAEAKNKIRIN